MLCLLCFVCLLPSLLPPASSYPMVMTTTVRPLPHISIATGGVWGRVQALPSPSSLLPLHPPPPPPVPPVHGHVPPQPCSQTILTTVHWDPWYPHHECPAGRFVHQLGFDDQLTPILLVNSLCKPCSFCPDCINSFSVTFLVWFFTSVKSEDFTVKNWTKRGKRFLSVPKLNREM